MRSFGELGMGDVATVGGKNASLGEMISALAAEGVPVPPGFATTADAYWTHMRAGGLGDRVRRLLEEAKRLGAPAESAGQEIRRAVLETPFPTDVAEAVTRAYRELCDEEGVENLPVAVRSSATAEDLPEASFAGQQESFLNVRGEKALLEACHRCFASLFTDRAISYRDRLGYDHLEVALSVGVQRMVRSGEAAAGVLFTIDTETGFPRVVGISAAWGLGEGVVKGTVDPDQWMVFKPLLDDPEVAPILESRRGEKAEKVVYDEEGGVRTVETSGEERAKLSLTPDEVLTLARWGVTIETHYGRPMDVEWAKDGPTGQLFIVQARPETVWAGKPPTVVRYEMEETVEPLVSGLAVGGAVASGPVRVVTDPSSAGEIADGSVLVAPRTDPDWGPYLRKAAAVVTDHGGTTSHAAIVCRELGVPAVVGTGAATSTLEDGSEVTVSCASGDRGHVYPGALAFERIEERLDDVPAVELPVMMNVATPSVSLRSWPLPTRGIGLTRLEFLIGDVIGIHPMALLRPDLVPDDERAAIAERTRGYDDASDYFVRRLAEGIAKIAASVHPHPAVVRTSDFKTNEYAKLLGGTTLEHFEENPMIGFRGASRYVSEEYRPAFELECRALRIVREEIGLDNVIPMIPFCRTLDEADEVLRVMATCGLERGVDGLRIYVMCEVPSNVVLAREFAARFDGFSIGSNDLTQLTLGVDRDNAALASVFDESNEAVTRLIEQVVRVAHEEGRTVGFCGQAPSNDPAYAEFLLHVGIDSISVDPDSVLAVTRRLAAAEASLRR